MNERVAANLHKTITALEREATLIEVAELMQARLNAVVGTHPRNVEGMVQHRKDLHDAATRRTETVLDGLERSGAVITFQPVARHAGVSRSWRYTRELLPSGSPRSVANVHGLRSAAAERATDASKDAIRRTLRQRLADEAAPRMSRW